MRDSRGRSPAPKPIGEMLSGFRGEVAPETVLAAVQAIWDETVGERISAVTDVVSEQEGTLTVLCSTAVWAQELELMGPRILSRLNESLGDGTLEKLRFRATG